MSDTSVTTLFDEIYSKVLKMIKTKSVNASDLVTITTYAMMVVQKYPGLTGPEKKQTVTDVVIKIVNESGLLNPEDQAAANMFIEITLTIIIDTIKSAYNHDFDLKKIKANWCSCLGSKTAK